VYPLKPKGSHVGKNNNTIEINGKRYDAKSGALLVGGHTASPKAAAKPKIAHQVAKHAGRAPAGSKTLMRHAVKKPGAHKKQFRAQVPAEVSAAQVVVSKSAKRVDPKRLQKAGKVPKSHLITHFAPLGQESTFEVPTTLPARSITAAPSKTKSAKHKTTADLLEQAILNATSHTELPHKPRKKAKRRSLAAASAVVVLAIGFIGYQQVPNLELHTASARAGIKAGLPGYQPAGYSLGQLNYSDGVVATQFHSNSDDRAYTLTQKRSNWDDAALRDSFVAPLDRNYQTADAGGLTVYLYGNGNATWVNGGLWYQVEANGALSNQQLVDLAKSL
jgi:hypothetical protein